jgi:hypothetical protein
MTFDSSLKGINTPSLMLNVIKELLMAKVF